MGLMELKVVSASQASMNAWLIGVSFENQTLTRLDSQHRQSIQCRHLQATCHSAIGDLDDFNRRAEPGELLLEFTAALNAPVETAGKQCFAQQMIRNLSSLLVRPLISILILNDLV